MGAGCSDVRWIREVPEEQGLGLDPNRYVLHIPELTPEQPARPSGLSLWPSDQPGGDYWWPGGHGPRCILDGDARSYWQAPEGSATSWVEVDLGRVSPFDRVSLQEAISQGQTISAYRVLAASGEDWQQICAGETIGHLRVVTFPRRAASRVRVELESSGGPATLRRLGIFLGRE
jgi:hypothetical protein